jgi:hypothetical protein
MNNERRSRVAIALLCVGLSALAAVPFYWLGQPLPGGSRGDFRMPLTHDINEHYDQMRSFYQGLQAGEVYPRWERDTNYGFGAPATSFYPPGIYYLTSALYFLLRDWLRALLAAHLLMMCASAAALYWLARRFLSRTAAAVAMAAYVVLPYHLADQYHREAMAELLGFIWMPLMLGFADELLSVPADSRPPVIARAGDFLAVGSTAAAPFVFKGASFFLKPSHAAPDPGNQHTRHSAVLLNGEAADFSSSRSGGTAVSQRRISSPSPWAQSSATVAHCALLACGLGAAYGAFLWSHPPTAYQFSLALAVTLPLLAAMRGNWRGLVWIAGGIALGLGLSAAYLYPAAAEETFIRSEVVAQTWPYRESYLFQADANARYPTFLALLNHSWWLGALAAAAVVIALVTLVPGKLGGPAAPDEPGEALASRSRSDLPSSVAFWALLCAVASFMMLRQSDFLGRHIPKLDIGVFSWRMLAISTLAVALLAGAATQAALDARRMGSRARSAVLAGVVLAIFVGAAWLAIGEAVVPVNAFPAFQPDDGRVNYLIVPRTAPCPDDLPDMDRVQTHGAGVIASVAEWEPQHRVIDVDALQADPLVIRTFNYPGWQARLDGRAVPLGTLPATGAIVVDVPPGTHVIALDFVDTPVRRRGVMITLVSAGVMLAVATFGLSAGVRRKRA